ncbi:MAG: endonuclease/exonuclease/phosphatase family protein [Candidatus Hydrogenedentes bacterium]|nr:endonuclease/exonuclease/phosphatase family protein [Candidatus Hydrogenedentota bacterium]
MLALVCGVALTAAAEADALHVMSFNLRYGKANDGPNAWPNRCEMLAAMLEERAPDIIGVQECLEFQAEFLDAALPEYGRFGLPREADGSGESAAIFYRKAILAPIETGNFWLSETPDVPGSTSWNSGCVRITTWARFYHYPSRRFFYLFNTHFDHASAEARAESARLLLSRIAAVPAELPVIVTGDFNDFGGNSEPWQVLTDGGLADAWLAAPERLGPVQTWHAFKPIDPESEKRIDWVLSRGGVTPEYCETVVYERDGRNPSDHHPVLVRYAFTD